MCVSVWYGVCVVSVCDCALRVFLLFKKGTNYSQNQILLENSMHPARLGPTENKLKIIKWF